MSDEDEQPDPLASLDQALAAHDTRAQILKHYMDALTGQGFDGEQAFTLTRDYAAKWGL